MVFASSSFFFKLLPHKLRLSGAPVNILLFWRHEPNCRELVWATRQRASWDKIDKLVQLFNRATTKEAKTGILNQIKALIKTEQGSSNTENGDKTQNKPVK
jgi:hypothetical protein